ncbi:2-dehydro-3-deoxyglucarate aldolase [Spirosoma daeguense]
MSTNSATRQLGTGTWLSIGSPIIAELASECGFDWLLFDLEHGNFTETSLLANLQAAKRDNIKLIVRIGRFDSALIARVLDWGASGIMLPHVSTVEQAQQCIQAMTYPPLGSRGYSSSVRAFSYGLSTQKNQETTPLFIAQIEDYQGVVNAESIAAINSVDMLFVGPADLKLDLSTQTIQPTISYQEAIKKVSVAAKTHQKQAGILVRNPADLPELKQSGYSCLAISSDLGFVREGFLSALRQ